MTDNGTAIVKDKVDSDGHDGAAIAAGENGSEDPKAGVSDDAKPTRRRGKNLRVTVSVRAVAVAAMVVGVHNPVAIGPRSERNSAEDFTESCSPDSRCKK